MSNQTLLLGAYSVAGVDSFDWWQELPNLSDYDVIILDTTRILNHWLMSGRLGDYLKTGEYVLSNVDEQDKRIQSNLQLVREKLVEILEFPVSVYVLYCQETAVSKGPVSDSFPLGRTFVGTNDWCPISIDTVSEKGKTIYVKDDSYKEYFRDFKGWEYYFVLDSIEISEFRSCYNEVTPELRVIATNKVQKPLAVEFVPKFHKPTKWGGNLVLLPAADRYHTESLIEVILRRGKHIEETPPPSWVNDIELPGEASLKGEIERAKEELKQLEASVSERVAALREIQKYKRLLYDTGLPLQDICKSLFEQLGAKPEPSPVSDEFIIEIEGQQALVEVKGNEKSIHKRDISQLITDRGQYLADTDQYVKGILVGNAWRHDRLEERDTPNKRTFSHEVVRIAQDQNIALVSTTELFDAYGKALETPQCKAEILNKMITGNGIIKF